MSALAQPTRLRVVSALARNSPEGLPAGELARRADTPQNTMSSHLAILARAGLVVATRSGRVIEYSADTSALAALSAFVAGLPAKAAD